MVWYDMGSTRLGLLKLGNACARVPKLNFHSCCTLLRLLKPRSCAGGEYRMCVRRGLLQRLLIDKEVRMKARDRDSSGKSARTRKIGPKIDAKLTMPAHTTAHHHAKAVLFRCHT
jgi:hypothetical protein